MRDFSGRRAGLYRANSLGRATAEANGVGLAGWSRRFICSGRRVVALPGFHQPLLLSAEIYRQPAQLTSVGLKFLLQAVLAFWIKPGLSKQSKAVSRCA